MPKTIGIAEALLSSGMVSTSPRAGTDNQPLLVGDRVEVLPGKDFEGFRGGDCGVVQQADTETSTCMVAFDGRGLAPLRVARRHLQLAVKARAAELSSSSSPLLREQQQQLLLPDATAELLARSPGGRDAAAEAASARHGEVSGTSAASHGVVIDALLQSRLERLESRLDSLAESMSARRTALERQYGEERQRELAAKVDSAVQQQLGETRLRERLEKVEARQQSDARFSDLAARMEETCQEITVRGERQIQAVHQRLTAVATEVDSQLRVLWAKIGEESLAGPGLAERLSPLSPSSLSTSPSRPAIFIASPSQAEASASSASYGAGLVSSRWNSDSSRSAGERGPPAQGASPRGRLLPQPRLSLNGVRGHASGTASVSEASPVEASSASFAFRAVGLVNRSPPGSASFHIGVGEAALATSSVPATASRPWSPGRSASASPSPSPSRGGGAPRSGSPAGSSGSRHHVLAPALGGRASPSMASRGTATSRALSPGTATSRALSPSRSLTSLSSPGSKLRFDKFGRVLQDEGAVRAPTSPTRVHERSHSPSSERRAMLSGRAHLTVPSSVNGQRPHVRGGP